MEQIFSIIQHIWELPWYKVLVIACVDDFILIIKLWWLYVIGLLIYILVFKWR
jgi:hypothetical protein